MSGEMFWSPEYRITRLNGMPSQMLAMMTDTSAMPGEVSQLIWPMPKACRTEFTIPLSLLSIHDQVEADTISGSNHGMRNIPRRTPESRKLFLKNTARPSPIVYWKAIETAVNSAVFRRAGGEVCDVMTSA